MAEPQDIDESQRSETKALPESKRRESSIASRWQGTKSSSLRRGHCEIVRQNRLMSQRKPFGGARGSLLIPMQDPFGCAAEFTAQRISEGSAGYDRRARRCRKRFGQVMLPGIKQRIDTPPMPYSGQTMVRAALFGSVITASSGTSTQLVSVLPTDRGTRTR
jgi:hypothetical protein